jgi:hypothetical protein
MLHLKLLEKQEKAKPKMSRRREIINVRAKNQQNREEKNKESMKQKLVL